MSLTIFPSLPDKTLAAVNTVGAWLAEDNLPYNPPALQRIWWCWPVMR